MPPSPFIIQMARVTRSSILMRIQDLLGLQSGAQAAPVECRPDIQPVLEVGNKATNIVRATGTTASGAGTTIYTTPLDKDFYLTFVNYGVTKDAANDCTETYILLTPQESNASTRLINIPMQTTTATSINVHQSYPHPIRLARGSTIQISGTFAAGTMNKRCAIGGYIVE